ncbi:MAG: Mrp/NBP35 family ATP-binding protein [Candidatus Micrarchaeia archaeon]
MQHIKHKLAVMSGKGGVGKSMMTALLALALQRRGNKVGVIDADITGASIPRIFGVSERLYSLPVGMIPAKTKSGIKIISANLLLEREDQPVIWRGPLISRVITEFLAGVEWGELDYLLVDLPPGTSDAPLTVIQSIPLDGVVLVTSPQELSMMVVKKAMNMAKEMGVPMLGMIENMSYYKCPHCGKISYIFGKGTTDKSADENGIPFLGKFHLDPLLSSLCDSGRIELYDTEKLDGIMDNLLRRLTEKS